MADEDFVILAPSTLTYLLTSCVRMSHLSSVGLLDHHLCLSLTLLAYLGRLVQQRQALLWINLSHRHSTSQTKTLLLSLLIEHAIRR